MDKDSDGIGPIPWIMISVVGIFGALVFLNGVSVNKDSGLPTYLNLEYVFYRIVKILNAIWDALVNGSLYTILAILLGLIGVAMAVVIAYTYLRSKEIEEVQRAKLVKIVKTPPVSDLKNERWESIKKHMESDNESEWRQAILDADVILDEMVTRMGYKGENLGEKLKTVEASDFQTLDNAWEAHKMRNRIAHDGSSFVLTKHEAKRVIGLFESTFREFEYL